MERHIIKQILLEQKEEIGGASKERIIDRGVMSEAKNAFSSDLIKVVMGVRRCGKSTLSHQFLKDKSYGYVNFDDERLIGVSSKDLNDFLEVLEEINPGFKYLLLDEVQNVEGWELFVNRLKRKSYDLVITGSNSNLLSKELATHLTGRYFNLELFPFSFKEFLSFKNVTISKDDFYKTRKRANFKRFLEQYLDIGGMPEVYKLKAHKGYLRELFDKIISQDIINRYGIKYVKTLKELALYAISNFSSSLTYHKVKNVFDIKSVHTIKNYLNYLEEAYLIFQVNPFSFKVKEQIKQARKVYCIDTGLINSFVPKTTPDYGKLIENLVFLELKRRQKEVYFYTQPNYEVDFLIKEGLKIKQLIQVCFSLADNDTKKREIRALQKASDKLKCDNLVIITWDQEGSEAKDSKEIRFIPLWKWLLR
jgi:hypothetical protein